MRREQASHNPALHEEIEELLDPEVGRASRTRDGSISERLNRGAGFVGEVRERYEKGRSAGRFSGLSAWLDETADEDIEWFFRIGWLRIALASPTKPEPNPWDHAPWNGDMQAYREDLYAGMTFGLPDIRALAREWLEELLRVGYHGMEESLRLPMKQQAGSHSSPPRHRPLCGDIHPVLLEDTGQTVWLRLDGSRSPERGYREISVSDEPLRTDAAIIATLTALEYRPLDVGILREVLPAILPLRGESFWDRWTRVLEAQSSDGALPSRLKDLRHHQTLDYVLALLRYHRPGFDDLPPTERANSVVETCEHANELMQVLRKFLAFLEHGRPNRRGSAATRVVARDVKAAILKDVDGLTNRQIGDELSVPLPADFLIKGDHPTVRKMVRRGKKILEDALGDEGWRAQAEAMKAEATRWRSIDASRRNAEIESETFGVPLEQAILSCKERRGGTRRDDEAE